MQVTHMGGAGTESSASVAHVTPFTQNITAFLFKEVRITSKYG